jgi:hypothetical protein
VAVDAQIRTAPPLFDTESLCQALQAADGAAFLVEPRVLRRLIKYDRRMATIGLRAPHRKTYVVTRETLLETVDRDELLPGGPLPPRVILLVRPDVDQWGHLSREAALLKYWRLLFHARVHFVLEEALAAGRLSEEMIGQRLARLGPAITEEARDVLRAEDYLLPPRDDRTLYVELCAVYWELRYFAEPLLGNFFPAMRVRAAVEAVLNEDVDAAALFEQARPAGAPDPLARPPQGEAESAAPAAQAPAAVESRRRPAGSSGRFAAWMGGEVKERRIGRVVALLLHQADAAARLGNDVRAAILRMKASRRLSLKLADQTRAAAQAHIDHLVERLQRALAFDNDDAQRWRSGLWALLEHSTDGIWPAEARLLYDLQKVCVDQEREVYTVDLVEWLFSLGRRPIRRILPVLRDVLSCRHLQVAAQHVANARIEERYRSRLELLIAQAAERADQQVRARVRPRIELALQQVGLQSANAAEEVARGKLVEELLDRLIDHGYFRMTHLRDAVSRNQLKLPDLSGFKELLTGDRLLQTDAQLAERLDGVYHPAEVYLRWFQRLSSLAFGNPLGRLVTKFVALPFGGAFVVLAGINYLLDEIAHYLPQKAAAAVPTGMGVAPEVAKAGGEVAQTAATNVAAAAQQLGMAAENVAATASEAASKAAEFKAPHPVALVLLGLFFFGLVNSAVFRNLVIRSAKGVRRGLSRCGEMFLNVLRLPLVKAILRSRAFVYFGRFVVKPALFTTLAWSVCDALGYQFHRSLLGTSALFAGLNLMLNSRAGRDFEEITNDWVVRSWMRIRVHVLAGLYWLVMDMFRTILEAVDSLLYTVDEWLRFRTGERRGTLVAKAVLGMFWFFATYLVRFCISLLIEPQVNPIKHFPVVTVSHKLLIPTIPILASLLQPVTGWDREYALFVAGVITTSIPGVFGFLAWELKENWRLYAANRPASLGPVRLGDHGDTMIRLLRPGIHSGTLPKVFRKLRRAEKKALAGSIISHKWHVALEHVRTAVGRFVERELVQVLNKAPSWPHALEVGEIHLATNCVRVEIRCPGVSPSSGGLVFERRSDWLSADFQAPSWSGRLAEPEATIFRNALLGLYKLAGVDFIALQFERLFGTGRRYELGADTLTFPDGTAATGTGGVPVRVVYDLTDRPRLKPRILGPAAFDARVPEPVAEEVLLSACPVAWSDWVAAWEAAAGRAAPPRLLPDYALLPDDPPGSLRPDM